MGRLGFAAVSLVLAGAAGVAEVSARPASYGVDATRSCLVKRGAELQTPAVGGAVDRLSPGQRAETLVGTLPAGNVPAFLYLVVGRNAADALALRKVLARSAVPNPTAANSWSGVKQNAAWVVVSVTGSAPSSAVHAVVLACLTSGAPPTGAAPPPPTHYARGTVSQCLETGGHATVVTGAELKVTAKRIFGAAIPADLAPNVLLAYTSTGSSLADGLGLFLVFGKTPAQAIQLRQQLEGALGLRAGATSWSDARKNLAWYAFHVRGTTAAGVTAGKKTLLGCLA